MQSPQRKLAGGTRQSIVFVQEGAVGLEAEQRLSLCFLGESSEACPLAEASRERERAVKLTGFPIFPRMGVCPSIESWKRQTCGSAKQAAPGKYRLCSSPRISWMAGAFRKLALSSWESLPLSRVCAYMPLSQSKKKKNMPNSGQPNRFPYIGKHELHSWWKKLTRIPPPPVTWLTLYMPEGLRDSWPAEGLVAVQRDLWDLIKIIFILAVCKKLAPLV